MQNSSCIYVAVNRDASVWRANSIVMLADLSPNFTCLDLLTRQLGEDSVPAWARITGTAFLDAGHQVGRSLDLNLTDVVVAAASGGT